ncbi:MAG: hypothetical protein R3F35_13915 [Myxococcota bacterium]
MNGPARAPYDESPARLDLRPIPAQEPWAGLQTDCLELIARGDLVTGIRARPASPGAESTGGPAAALLLLHDAGSHASGSEWRRVAAWLARGPHAFALDLPLHGRRSSAKLSERLIAGLASLERGLPLDRNGEALVEEALRQARCDVARLLDGVLAMEDVDPKRVGLVAVGFGARVAEMLLAEDARPCAAVLIRDANAVVGAAMRDETESASTAVLRLEARRGATDWSEAAEAYLGSRIGF